MMGRFNLQCLLSRGNVWYSSRCNKSPRYVTSLYYCTTDTEEKTPKPDPHAWRKQWFEREGEWYSNFKLFAPESGGSPDFIRFVQTDINFRPSNVKKWWKEKREEGKVLDQRYIAQRHQTLGNDLATAHFIVHRGGAVQFEGSPLWIRQDKNEEYSLPSHYIPEMKICAVDASKTDLMHEGLANNVVGLKKLKLLKLRECPYIDDWCLDLISAENADTLEILDLSHCPLITERGLSVLHRLKNLKELHLEGIEATTFIRLACVLLEEANPKLIIHGVSHITVPHQD